jgi:hypothetical protein
MVVLLLLQKLYWQTGCVNIGEPLFSQALATAEHYQLPHEVLSAKQANARFPGDIGVFGAAPLCLQLCNLSCCTFRVQ